MADALSPRPVLWVVAVSHLDSQWRWTLRQTIAELLPRTVAENRERFARHPRHVLSFEGAFRYRLLAESAPQLFAEGAGWVSEGRWSPAGATWEAADCILPAPESIVRQILHGQRFFRQRFGRESGDLLLPDCFGFPAALPSLAAHCGVLGFSTQKLRLRETLRAAEPIPFHLGVWEGPDGSELLAALDPGGYGEAVTGDLSRDPAWRGRLADLERAGHPAVGFTYTGIGDRGGGLPEESLVWLDRSLAGDGPIEVRHAASEQPFRALAPDRARLPRFRGELLLGLHASGGYTSLAAVKRGNRECERLAQAAERAAATALSLGGMAGCAADLAATWQLFLAHQMHDTLCGTCIPEAYELAANDQALALVRSEQVLLRAACVVARSLDTRACSSPVLVFNPIGRERDACIDLRLPWSSAAPTPNVAAAPDGRLLPLQTRRLKSGELQALFVARLPALGWSVFDLRAGPAASSPELSASDHHLENQALRAELDPGGNLERLFDKERGAEAILAPLRWELLRDRSERFPAWEILFADISQPPREIVGAPAVLRLVESGPVRATIEVERQVGRTRLRERWSLAAGAAGRRLEWKAEVDWWSRGRLLKARFPLGGEGCGVAYDGGLGAVERGVNRERLYEVPAQHWADASTPDGSRGMAILSPLHAGWDRPDAGVLRLSLLRTPEIGHRFRYQRRQDLGRHQLRFALYPHRGDWRSGGVVEEAESYFHPPLAFAVPPGTESAARERAWLREVPAGVSVQALKPAEDGDGQLVVRLREIAGRMNEGSLDLADALDGAEWVDGCERPISPAELRGSRVVGQPLRPFGLVACKLTPRPASPGTNEAASRTVALPGSLVASLRQGERGGAGFDGHGTHLPAELVPRSISALGVELELARNRDGNLEVTPCTGQRIPLPPSADDDSLFFLAASVRGDRRAVFATADRRHELVVHDWRLPLGAWDQFVRYGRVPWRRWRPGFFRRAPVAWTAMHLHDRRGRDLVYEYGHLFLYRIDPAPGSTWLSLPDDASLRIAALAIAPGWRAAARPLFDFCV